jgi:hypothetical protein
MTSTEEREKVAGGAAANGEQRERASSSREWRKKLIA